jgi:hypothetical protein
MRARSPSVAKLMAEHGDAKLTDLLLTLAACPEARSASIHDRCKAVYGQLLPYVDPAPAAGLADERQRRLTKEETPTAILVRQVVGAIAEFVAKLAAARKRKRVATGNKVEGRKSHAETRPEAVALAKALARKKPKGGKPSLRTVSAALAEQGYFNERGRPFNPKSVAVMLAPR